MADTERQYAIIAGSGFREFGGDDAGRVVDTEFGRPDSPVRELVYGEHRVLLLARHGDAIDTPPHRINYRANLAALKQLNADSVIALNTVGVIRSDLHPGQIAVPSQLLDYTWGREHTLFDGSGPLEHIDFTEPFSPRLRRALIDAAIDASVALHDGGVYATMQGPRLETAAEVDRIERDGADFVGMTAMPEAALARELGMEYACLSLIVNYAAGRGQKPIHDDLEAGTMTAKLQAMKVLRALFGALA